MMDKLYTPTSPDIWKGRIDSVTDIDQFRLHQVVRCENVNKLKEGGEIVLGGFACDVGVARNKGRIGAAEGPEYFRRSVGNLCWHGAKDGFVDAGTVYAEGEDLEAAQKTLGNFVKLLLEKQKIPFIIGGGHETAFGHYLGIASFLKEKHLDAKLGIINIDAHFDLRPYDEHAHSGSPFLQALEHAQVHGVDTEYFVFGINEFNNTKSLFDTASRLGVKYITNREIQSDRSRSIESLKSFIKNKTHIYLTICLDVFESSIAPGVSAPAWQGIQLYHAQEVLNSVKDSEKLLSMDICELNPAYDPNLVTVKTAGMLFAQFLIY